MILDANNSVTIKPLLCTNTECKRILRNYDFKVEVKDINGNDKNSYITKIDTDKMEASYANVNSEEKTLCFIDTEPISSVKIIVSFSDDEDDSLIMFDSENPDVYKEFLDKLTLVTEDYDGEELYTYYNNKKAPN